MSVHLDEDRSGWTVMEAAIEGNLVLTRHLRPSPPLELAVERALVGANMKGRPPCPIAVGVERDMLVLRTRVDGTRGHPAEAVGRAREALRALAATCLSK